MFYNLTILLPCFTCLFVFFSLIIKLKNINRSQLVLTILSLFASFFFFVQATYLGGITNIKVYYILDSIDSFVTLTILPLIFIYFRTITSYKPINWTLILLFLPAFIIGCCTAFFYYVMTANELIGVGS